MQPLTSLNFSTLVPNDCNEAFCVRTPADRIPPFQINRPMSAHTLAEITVEAVRLYDGTTQDLKALRDAGAPMRIVTLSSGIDVIIWDSPDAYPLTADITAGKFYVKVYDGENTWYSRQILMVDCGYSSADNYFPTEDDGGFTINQSEMNIT